MPRWHRVPRADVDAPVVQAVYDRLFGQRDPVAEPGMATGTSGNRGTVFALVPDVLEHASRGFGLQASPKRRLASALRELGQTRAGWREGSRFVFSPHGKSCRALGMSDAERQAIKAWGVSDLFAPESGPCWPAPVRWCRASAAWMRPSSPR